MNAINRRSFVAGAAFGISGAVIAAPIAKPAAAPAAVSDAELISLFARLSRKRQEDTLGWILFQIDRQERQS